MTRLGLAEVRWRTRRDPAGGLPLVSVSFLDLADRRTAVAAAGIAAYVASLVGKARRAYDADVPIAIAGDRRLGHGLAAVCLGFFRWTSRGFAEALPPRVVGALAGAGIDTPSALRLRLFDLVNERYAGFVPRGQRDEALALLAEALGLPADAAAHLDAALTLDHEDEAILCPEPEEEQFHPAAVVARYNRAVLAALLRNAERIAFTVQSPGGAQVRRLYALCRRLGVYCDIEQTERDSSRFCLTLSGPDAVVAASAAAGPRLAPAALTLLDHLGPEDRGTAFLVLRDRPCRLVLDAKLRSVPGLSSPLQQHPQRGTEDLTEPSPGEKRATPLFDSEVEERLAREFESLRRQGRAGGWRLVREPGLLMAGGRVLIPDFALERDGLRVYVEVVGFWTPGYIQKKRQALERLAPETPLVLAAAEGLAEALVGLPFPVLPYRQEVHVPALLALVESCFGDFAARTEGARERLAHMCAAVAAEGWIPEAALSAALRCYSPGELQRVLASIALPEGWEHLPGAGLCGPALREALARVVSGAWQQRAGDAALALGEVRALCPALPLPETDDALAAILDRLPVCRVVRPSLFEVEVRPPGEAAPAHRPPEQGAHNPASPKKAAPRRRAPGSVRARLF